MPQQDGKHYHTPNAKFRSLLVRQWICFRQSLDLSSLYNFQKFGIYLNTELRYSIEAEWGAQTTLLL